jgi:hypothetical protein
MIVTDKLRSYRAARNEIMPSVEAIASMKILL